ncbi:sensor histidine kinase [Paenibacillus sp. y28]|uniref:sensor histidine kinase n=1 Tax=Paenibacillus sp. y28 TaxID=3129110 RepID=UPI003017C9C1
MLSRFRQMHVLLFVTLMGCFLLILTAISFVYDMNWESVFDAYQNEQLQIEAYKMMDDIRNAGLTVGPYTEEQAVWLTRRATLYGILIRYGEDRRQPWFDMFTGSQPPGEVKMLEFPVVARGDTRGWLQVARPKAADELDPNVLAFQESMRVRTTWVFIAAALLSVLVSYAAARLLSRHLNRLQATASKIRLGDREQRAPLKGPEEVRQLALTLNELALELKKQEDWRHHLMVDFTHELRTPLTSMQSQLEAMLDGIYEVNVEWLEQIYEELIRLTRLMLDMERLSEAEAARFTMNMKRCNMVDLAESVYRNFSSMAKQKGIRLQFVNPYVPCYAQADRDKLIQVVSNIVSNAIKYTHEGGSVVLAVEWTEEETLISCRDNGIGIGAEDLPYVFNRLYRADKSRSRFSGGVGIGLSISKALAEAHDGRIEVNSELGKGSEFRVYIPNLYRSAESAAQLQPPRSIG